MLAATAAAQARGVINTEHVTVIAKAVAKLPGFVDAATREQFETDLVRLAAGASPKDVSDAAELALFLLDQDGPEPDDTERARRRGISKGRQRGDAMTPISGELTPEAWALLEGACQVFCVSRRLSDVGVGVFIGSVRCGLGRPGRVVRVPFSSW